MRTRKVGLRIVVSISITLIFSIMEQLEASKLYADLDVPEFNYVLDFDPTFFAVYIMLVLDCHDIS